MDEDWVDQHRQNELIATAVVMTTLAAIVVTLRLISRFILIRNPGPDDYFIAVAMLFTIGYLIDIFILRNNHVGFPMTMLTPQNMINFIKATLAIQVMYYIIICCIKVSILFTYLRFAVSKTFRMLCIGTIVLHCIFFFICFVTTLAQCKPLHKMWDMTGTVPGTCINTTAFFYFTSAFNIVTDIWILLLPIKTLREINRPNREKIALFLIFGVGTFAAVASIVRLHTIYTYTLATDPFREGILVNLWSMIEVTIAISCASVSALKPIFSRRQRRITRAAVSKSGTTSSSRYGTQSQVTQQQQHSWSPWHIRLGSKDYGLWGSSSKDPQQTSQSTDTTTGIGSDEMGSPSTAEMGHARTMEMVFPPQRPRLVALQPTNGGRGGPGAEPEPETSESSMIIFSPLSEVRRLPGHNGEDGGLSSSGSILVLQR
ncbi:hypothetical protein B0H66DRAFT_143991 [Apodospora peruviana]|uniref:Rhodopsin domain-containing protein n=1 Tax=Apodospora peruviana TaxID=516989 RepID=A0AAE0IJ90_9PEZI|nr:hypothetical protein B0H66DRAFT_143991 [Apodospora peruviana]